MDSSASRQSGRQEFDPSLARLPFGQSQQPGQQADTTGASQGGRPEARQAPTQRTQPSAAPEKPQEVSAEMQRKLNTLKQALTSSTFGEFGSVFLRELMENGNIAEEKAEQFFRSLTDQEKAQLRSLVNPRQQNEAHEELARVLRARLDGLQSSVGGAPTENLAGLGDVSRKIYGFVDQISTTIGANVNLSQIPLLSQFLGQGTNAQGFIKRTLLGLVTRFIEKHDSMLSSFGDVQEAAIELRMLAMGNQLKTEQDRTLYRDAYRKARDTKQNIPVNLAQAKSILNPPTQQQQTAQAPAQTPGGSQSAPAVAANSPQAAPPGNGEVTPVQSQPVQLAGKSPITFEQLPEGFIAKVDGKTVKILVGTDKPSKVVIGPPGNDRQLTLTLPNGTVTQVSIAKIHEKASQSTPRGQIVAIPDTRINLTALA